ncbi:MAG TPA: hypothetical protein DGL25_01045 [Dehalococcoidia bacterium]|nr:hypothetical protein [Dehalococcoidia bacterium]
MLLGVLGALAALAVMLAVSALVLEARGEPRDVGDLFAKAREVTVYADQRLAAATKGEELPKTPQILGDQQALSLTLGITLVLQLTLAGVVVGVTRHNPRALAQRLGLTNPNLRGFWRPVVAVISCYLMIVTYSAIVNALDIEALQPESTVPYEVVRNQGTLALTGLVVILAAPFTEELLYRGLIFGGLQRWGFWPAALISGAAFSAVHFEPGSLIPFFIIGVTLAWLFWRRGNLWESVAFHMLFNTLSFSLLIATEL